MPESNVATLAINTIKTLSIDAVEKAKSGHPGTPMGLAEIAFEVFTNHLRHDPTDPNWIARDRFVLSNGHASMLLYSILHLTGYDLPMKELENFRQWESKTPGHPEHGFTVGVETTTGPLGQGIGNAVGFALAQKILSARFGAPFADSRVIAICGDGDQMEGVASEASSLGGHLGLDNLVLIYDDNRITIEGETHLAFSEDVGKRYEAYGWAVLHVDGHDRKAIGDALRTAKATKGKPTFIVARTHIGNGAPTKHDTKEAHGEPLGAKEIEAYKKSIDWTYPAFTVPDEVRAFFKEKVDALKKDHAAWTATYQAWRGANAELAKTLDAFLAREVPADLYEKIVAAVPPKEEATRNLSNAVEQVVAKYVPSLIGGSADLSPSTKTLIKDGGSISRENFAGRNMHFGIREHGMGSVCNALALADGIIPFGSTFLIFSDYMRPAIRLSSILEKQVLWIYTHDSFFLGEDGPTHQSIEQLWSLRMIPRLHVVRPADALETAAAWTYALSRKHGPTLFALTRQKLPVLNRVDTFDPKVLLRGGYVLQDPSGTPDVVLVGTGSEVGLAVQAAAILTKAGKKVRVVSMPCVEAFQAQDAAYRESVLPKTAKKVSIEAGRSEPWQMVIGSDGLTIGVDRFGASAPDKVLAEKFGFTPEGIAKRVGDWAR